MGKKKKKKKKQVKRSAQLETSKSNVGLDAPHLYINRELSWLQFNHRVLEEALDKRHPLLERVKFLSIFASNLDEFFMIRVSGLRRQLAAGALKAPPDGMTPAEQLAAIRRELLPELSRQYDCWHYDLLPKLREAGIKVLNYSDLKHKQCKLLRQYFREEIFPTLTPLAFDPGHPFPHISNLSLNLAVVINDPLRGERFARLKAPGTFPRLLRIPSEETADDYQSLGLAQTMSSNFVWLEEAVVANLDMLFPGMEVVAAYPFRVTRDADPEIEEDEAADLLTSIQESVRMRHFGLAVRLEVDGDMSERVRDTLIANLGLAPYQVYTVDGPIGLADLVDLARVNRPELKDSPFQQSVPPPLSPEKNIFSAIRHRNVLLYHPYDSFDPVVEFVRRAARDPNVLAIKQTLYRVGPDSPIVAALMKARKNGKQVAVLVELKARFDEENNIVWARALEQAGVHVVYGVMGLKTHTKLLLVVRREGAASLPFEREGDTLTRYVHMSTGNYNDVTARLYTDIGFFTCDPDIGADVSDLFNALTGYSTKQEYRKLLVAPGVMRKEILNRIEREIERHQERGDGYLAFKMNALVDRACIQALYRASQAGVKVDLQVRGICCLRPGVPRVSENITVTSIVGRFLEHPRLYYFHNGGEDEMLLGSADLMPRNLDRRVEQLFPVEDARLRDAVRAQILGIHLRDNVQARRLLPDGSYERVHPEPGEPELDSQSWMIEHRGIWHSEE
ncbi:MAG: polyphosphate kinase 1 [Chloroflexi bacterium]|nr:MAG: polyphosphate kinase 1 [Chloroflexota bacterium]